MSSGALGKESVHDGEGLLWFFFLRIMSALLDHLQPSPRNGSFQSGPLGKWDDAVVASPKEQDGKAEVPIAGGYLLLIGGDQLAAGLNQRALRLAIPVAGGIPGDVFPVDEPIVVIRHPQADLDQGIRSIKGYEERTGQSAPEYLRHEREALNVSWPADYYHRPQDVMIAADHGLDGRYKNDSSSKGMPHQRNVGKPLLCKETKQSLAMAADGVVRYFRFGGVSRPEEVEQIDGVPVGWKERDQVSPGFGTGSEAMHKDKACRAGSVDAVTDCFTA